MFRRGAALAYDPSLDCLVVFGGRAGTVDIPEFLNDVWELRFSSDAIGIGPEGTSATLAAPFPNPASGPIEIAFTLPDERPAILEVIDLAGRRLASWSLGGGPGSRSVSLPREALPAAGLVFVRLIHGGVTMARKVALVR